MPPLLKWISWLGAFTVLTVLSGSLAVLANPLSDSPSECINELERAIRAVDAPPSQRRLQQITPDPQERLLNIARDRVQDPWTRQRAITLLSAYPNEETLELFLQVSKHPGPLQQLTLYTLAKTFGETQFFKILPILEKTLHSPVPSIRDQTVRALGWIQHPAAELLLQSLLDHPDSTTHLLVKKSLHRLQEALWLKKVEIENPTANIPVSATPLLIERVFQ